MAVLAGVVAMSVAVAAYALVARQSSKPQNVACFAAADLTAQTAVVGVDAEGPVAACLSLWANGLPRAHARAPVAGVPARVGRGRRVPRGCGTGCVSRPGPGRGVVAGTAHPDRDRPARRPRPVAHDRSTHRFFAFRDAVLARFVGQGCIGAVAAEAIVREELDRAGLDGWTVTTGVGADGAGFSAGRPCASLNFHPEVRSVDLVPVPPPPG